MSDTDPIKRNDPVRVTSTQKIARIVDIQYTFNRYQLRGVSDWQYDVADLEKLDIDSLINTIESQNRTIKTYEEVQQGWIDSHAKNFKQIESQKEEIEGYKAITELAVKGLKEMSSGVGWNWETYMDMASDTLEEIERLTHE